jgi:hypothetical protein
MIYFASKKANSYPSPSNPYPWWLHPPLCHDSPRPLGKRGLCLIYGIDAYVFKPIDVKKCVEVIRELLN